VPRNPQCRLPTQPRWTAKARFFSSQIIAILAAILFPVFARAREKARQTSCLSNVKEIALAGLMYVQDYDELMFGNNNAPCTYLLPDGSVSTSVNMLWMYQVVPYIKNAQIFNCPSSTNRWPPNAYSGSLGYGFNDKYLNRVALALVKSPASELMLVDCIYYLADWDSNADNHQPPNPVHNEGSNVAFMDGHAKWMKATSIAFYSPDVAAHLATECQTDVWSNK